MPPGSERDLAITQSLKTASRHWIEATALDPATVPVSTIHTAYYAMFHLARAMLITVKGTCPYRHSSVARDLALLLEGLDNPAGQSTAKAFELAQRLRESADYDPGATPAESDARKILDAMRSLAELAANHIGIKCRDISAGG